MSHFDSALKVFKITSKLIIQEKYKGKRETYQKKVKKTENDIYVYMYVGNNM